MKDFKKKISVLSNSETPVQRQGKGMGRENWHSVGYVFSVSGLPFIIGETLWPNLNFID